MDAVQEASESGRPQTIEDMPIWAWTIIMSDRLTLYVDLEYLPEGNRSNVPFSEQTGEQAWMFDDDYLPDHPVYFVKRRKVYRLHVRVTPKAGFRVTVQRVVSVVVTPPDGSSIALPVEQRNRDAAVVALALLDPAQMGSARLQKISPHFGTVEVKYVKLDVHIKILVGEGLGREIDFRKGVYCKVVHPKNKLRLHRWVGMIKNRGVVRRPFELD